MPVLAKILKICILSVFKIQVSHIVVKIIKECITEILLWCIS